MKRTRHLNIGLRLLLTLAVLMLAANFALAQQVTAAITGTVVDPSGAAIAGATVTATDTNRGTVWKTETNNTGAYNLPRLPVGSYTVQADAKGFQAAKYANAVTLELNQIATIDLKMKIGNQTETVEVTGAAPILQTQTSEVSTLISGATATSVPLAARNYIQLTLLTPGATSPNPQTLYQAQSMPSSGRPYINGNREQANEFLLDGMLNSEDNNNEVGYQPSVDAIQEFNVITQNASAEFGNYQGGIVNTSIKSGTNGYHGDVFEFLRNDALNANTWSAGLSQTGPSIPGVSQPDGVLLKPKVRWNQFGGTFGGPIFKNKLFFFADYQGQRFDHPFDPVSVGLFTPAEVAGDFGALCAGGFDSTGKCLKGTQLKNPTTGAIIPNNNLAAAGLTINPVAGALFALPQYTAAQQTAGGSSSFFSNSSNHLNVDQGDLRIDWNATDNDRVYGRWSQSHLSHPALNTFILADPGATEQQPVRNFVTGWTHTFSPTILNEFRGGFSAVDYNQTDEGSSPIGQQIGINGANAFANGLPQLNIGSITYGTNGLLQIFHTTSIQAEDNVTITRGRHTVHTGFQYWRERLDFIYPGNNGLLGILNFSGGATGSPLSDFWLGQVAGGGQDGGGEIQFGRRGNVVGFFGQDDWRISDNLTINYGIRFEDHTPFYEIDNREFNFGLIDGQLQTEKNHNALYNNYLGAGDWQPRIGVAWSPSALHGKTVIRAAYGISSYAEGGGANQLLTKNFVLAQGETSTFKAENLSTGFAGTTASACTSPITISCFVGQSVKVFNPDWRPAMSQQWSLTVEQQLSNTLTFQLGYVGQHGTHLLNLMDYQQEKAVDASGNVVKPGELSAAVLPSEFLAANSVLKSGFIGGTDSNASQRYDSLQAVLRKRMSGGLEGQVAYTYSKCLTNSAGYFGTSAWGGNGAQTSLGLPGWQNIYDGRAEWGPCFYDETHILSSYATYDVPLGRGQKFGHDVNSVADQIIGHWQMGGIVSLHTGNAITPTIGFQDTSNTNGAGGLFASERPACLGAPSYPDQLVHATNVGGTFVPGYVQYFDPTTFAIPAQNTFGNCSNGVIRGPGYADVDMSIHKSFPISEGKRLEFRTEFINLFNHPILNFGPALTGYGCSGKSLTGGLNACQIDPTVNTNFGQISQSQGERNIQFALKFYF